MKIFNQCIFIYLLCFFDIAETLAKNQTSSRDIGSNSYDRHNYDHKNYDTIQNYDDKHINKKIKEESKIKFFIAPEILNYQYIEPDIMEMYGIFYGLNGLYKTKYSILSTRYLFGYTDYSSNNTGKLSKIPNNLLEMRYLYYDEDHFRFKLSRYSNIKPFLGIGFRRKNDDSSAQNSTTGYLGYKRSSNYLYIPIGLMTNIALKNINIDLIFEFDKLLYGLQMSYLLIPELDKLGKVRVDDSGNFIPSDVTILMVHHQYQGYGAKFEALFSNKTQKWFIGPYINIWNIDQSTLDMNTSTIEPPNNTLEFGIKAYYSF